MFSVSSNLSVPTKAKVAQMVDAPGREPGHSAGSTPAFRTKLLLLTLKLSLRKERVQCLDDRMIRRSDRAPLISEIERAARGRSRLLVV